MKKDYAKLEDKVISLFPQSHIFRWNENSYKVLMVGKPTISKGDPKTDCYIQAVNLQNNEKLEIKISCKLEDINEFQENKINDTRALNIFGVNWEKIIQDTSTQIKDKFEKTTLSYPEGFGRTKDGHVILGWKVDISSKPRNLSSKLTLNDQEIRDHIYKGLHQPREKKDARVNGIEIKDSAVPEYMLITKVNDINTSSDVLDKLINIDDYEVPEHYLIFTATSYSIQTGKTEASRKFGVRVEWHANQITKELVPTIKYDSPLKSPSTARDMMNLVEKSLSQIPEHKNTYKLHSE